MLLTTNYQFLGRQMVHMCDMLTCIDYSLYLRSTSKGKIKFLFIFLGFAVKTFRMSRNNN
jgi:hypothetical protein